MRTEVQKAHRMSLEDDYRFGLTCSKCRAPEDSGIVSYSLRFHSQDSHAATSGVALRMMTDIDMVQTVRQRSEPEHTTLYAGSICVWSTRSSPHPSHMRQENVAVVALSWRYSLKNP